jgi:hypothetical protein
MTIKIDWDRDPVARVATLFACREIDLRHCIAAGHDKLVFLLACAGQSERGGRGR